MLNVKFENINNSEILNNEQRIAFDKVATAFQSSEVTSVTLQKSIFGKDRVNATITFNKPIMHNGSMTLNANLIIALSQLTALNRIKFNQNKIELSL